MVGRVCGAAPSHADACSEESVEIGARRTGQGRCIKGAGQEEGACQSQEAGGT